jgi:lincosamide nucleotidyltransferase A/C/D/E
MTAQDVAALYRLWESHGLTVWIDGGWAVDALLEKETRRHSDLDIALRHTDVPQLRCLLQEQGFLEVPRNDSWECNFVLEDAEGRRVDVHSFLLDQQGHNAFGVAYEAQHLTGIGLIAGQRVRCIGPDWLVKFHTGYRLDQDDYHDVKLLCERFGLELPPEYRSFQKQAQ